MSSCQMAADHHADLDDMQHRLDEVESRASLQQRADRQRIDELMQENERLSEQLLTVSLRYCATSLLSLYLQCFLISLGLTHFLLNMVK